MIKNYLNQLKQKKKTEDQNRINNLIKRKLTSDMDLNVKTEMYAVRDKDESVLKDAEIIKRKLELQKAGLR